MIILGIETSCDETAAALIETPRRVLSNVVASQIDLHGPYGGVVPEIASREHVRVLPMVIETAVHRAGLAWGEIGAVAVTFGPGLAGALLVGLNTARALAARLNIPLIGINHLQGHIFSPFLSDHAPMPETVCPFVSLVVSGGHTSLVRVTAPGQCRLLGQTLDDAAGEAFDKGANLLGLGYPGGPALDRLARSGDPRGHRFPRGRASAQSRTGRLDPSLCFSFSGIKTALRYELERHPLTDSEAGRRRRADLAASYQEAIVDALTRRAVRALGTDGTLALGGGVSMNSRLRSVLTADPAMRGHRLLLTDAAYGGDNAAMIAFVAALGLGRRGERMQHQDVCPGLGVADSF